MTAVHLDALAYYAAHRASLFPIPAGQKNPTGIVASFAHDCSNDPTQWRRWRSEHPGCNFGIVAGPSRLVIVDVDVVKLGRDEAWAAWCEWCATAGIAPILPQVQSARGGWHIYFRLPDDAPPLRQVALCNGIDLRVGNGYTIAAGSWYDDNGTPRPYVLLSDAPPHPAPAALLDHCKRSERAPSATRPGERDREDVAALITWLAERDAFAGYEDWCACGMALRLEYGDDGLDLWRLATWPDAQDAADVKWGSFATEPTADSVTIASLLQRAHSLGWRGTVRKSAASMFGSAGAVAALAANSGATLPGVPMLAGQEELTRLATPILEDFLANTQDAPTRPIATDYPTIPESCNGHGLYAPLRECIDRIVAMAETPAKFKASRCVSAMAVLSLVHSDTFDAIVRRIQAAGGTLPTRPIKLYAASLSDKVERAFVSQDDWIRDHKGEIEHNNPDNVSVFLGILGVEIRWNSWTDRMEIRGDEWRDWTYIDDTVHAKLSMRAGRTKTRFLPSDTFLWKSLMAIAHDNPVDPAIDRLAALEAAWDGTPRLAVWLSATCGVPCDPYHQAVAKNIIGGMVRRIREPGCKHDEIAILYGPQGTGKSTLARMLAPDPDWFSDEVMLGDASKELVLSLAGMAVIEVSEMGMRGAANTNHVKAMLSRVKDRGRTAYARAVSERPRRNIFIGTTNESEPLTDPTGNRRYLPVAVPQEVNLAWLATNAAQLIGEAAALHSRGATFELPRDVWGVAAEHQAAARAATDMEIQMNEWFEPTEMAGPFTWITSADLVSLADMAHWRGGTQARGLAMRMLGFRIEKVPLAGKKVSAWVRGDATGAQIVRQGTRYVPQADATGRARVVMRREGAGAA